MITGIPDDYPVADLPAWTRSLNQMVLDTAHPIGDVVTRADNINPADLYGGIWTPYAPGCVLVGLDDNNPHFNTIGMTGGVAEVTLTAAQSGSPAHLHVVPATTTGTDSPDHAHTGHTDVAGHHAHAFTTRQFAGWDGHNGAATGNSGNASGLTTAGAGDHQHTLNISGASARHAHSVPARNTAASTAVNATEAHTNLQPYTVVRHWIRTA